MEMITGLKVEVVVMVAKVLWIPVNLDFLYGLRVLDR